MAVKAPVEVIPETYGYVFSPYREPIARVGQGQRVVIHCEDAFESRIRSAEDLPSRALAGAKFLNPQTGPIYVEGAEPGDVLAVRIEEITPTRDFAVSCLIPFFGGLTSTSITRTLQPSLPEKVWIWRLEQGNLVNDELELALPWQPFMGTLAVDPLAPDRVSRPADDGRQRPADGGRRSNRLRRAGHVAGDRLRLAARERLPAPHPGGRALRWQHGGHHVLTGRFGGEALPPSRRALRLLPVGLPGRPLADVALLQVREHLFARSLSRLPPAPAGSRNKPGDVSLAQVDAGALAKALRGAPVGPDHLDVVG